MLPAVPTEPVYRVRGLTKSYGDRRVLDDIDFDVVRGECLVILGRSGQGKSVTLRQLIQLERPDSGSIDFDGSDITRLKERELYSMRRRLTMLFQSGALFDSLDVFENVAYPLREHSDLAEAEIASRVAERLDWVGLAVAEHGELAPSALSGGQRKRVALARALALDPEVVLFDEPTTGLDPMTSATIAHLISSIQKRTHTTSVVVTHDIPLTRAVADRIAFLDEGKLRFLGTLAEAEAASDPLVLRFLEGRREDE